MTIKKAGDGKDKELEPDIGSPGIQKDQKPLVNVMLRTVYTEVIFKTICILLANRAYRIFESIKITSDVDLPPEKMVEVRAKYFEKILAEHQVQKELTLMLDDIQKQKSDILAEVLKQYGMDKGQESTYYHDFLQTTFDGQLWKVRMLVKNCKFKELFD
jgi:hypothetical protein